MIRLGWKRFIMAGLCLVVASAPFGVGVASTVFFVLALASIAAILTGVRAYRPARSSVWYLIAASLGLMLFGSVVDILVVPSRVTAASYPGLQEPFDLTAYGGFAVAIALMARARLAGRDRTITLDALISMGGVAALAWVLVIARYLHSDQLSALGKATGIAFSVMSLVMGFMTVRVAIGPGARPVSYRLMSIGVASAFVSELCIELDLSGRTRLPVSELLSMVVSAAGVVLLAGAALHPSMASLTAAPIDTTPKMTRRRLAAMTLAVLIPPMLLVGEPARRANYESLAIIAVWAALSVMVMIRVFSLARAREDVAELDRVLAEAESALAAAADRDMLVDAVLDAAFRIVPSLEQASTHVWADGWQLVAFRGSRILAPLGTSPPLGLADEAAWRDDRLVTDIHFTAADVATGVFTLATRSQPDPMELARVNRLVADLARAMESAALREDLGRQRSERRFQALVEHSADIIIVIGADHEVTFVSPAGPRLLRRETHDLIGRTYAELVRPDHLERFWGLVERPGREPVEIQLVTGDGTSRWFDVSAVDMTSEPEIHGIVVTASEISARKQAQLDLERSEARFRSLVQHASDLVAVLDATGIVSWVSPSVVRLLDRSQDDVVDRSLIDLAHPADRVQLAEVLSQIAERAAPGADGMDLRIGRSDGSWRTLEVTITNLLEDPAVAGVVLNAHDITERRELELDLWHQALHDDLTKLPNRVQLRSRIQQALAAGSEHVAVLVIDIDDFKTINDGLGHSIGDELLVVLAERLSGAVRDGDLAARLGGDEFALLIDGSDRVEVTAIAQRLLRDLEQPATVSNREISVHASIGIAFAVDVSEHNAEAMLRSADLAMYGAKNRGKGRVAVFDESMQEGAFERLELKADLARALERNELVLHYQPVVDLARGTIAGFEALMRWNHGQRGMVGPGTFIPLAEETGLIVPIGSWLVDTALTQLRIWQERYPSAEPLTMSINLSGRQLEEPGIAEELRAAIARSGVDPTSVVVELTESMVVSDSPELVSRLREIRAIGVGLHADDFGTGFASYAALQSLPFTGVKIDRSLVSGLDGSAADRAWPQIRSIIEMSAETGMLVVAEGIESGAQAQALRELNCEHAQGFYFARPAEASAVDRELARRALPTVAR